MSEQTDATQDRPDEDDVELAREDRDELAGGAAAEDDEEPQPWARLSSGDDD